MVTLCHHPTYQTYLQTLLVAFQICCCLLAVMVLLLIYVPMFLFCPLGQAYLVHIVPVKSSVCVCVCGWVGGCELYLRVEWRWQISELRDVGLKRSQIAFVSVRAIAALQTVPPLRL